MRRSAGELLIFGLAVAVIVGVPAVAVWLSVSWIEERFGTNMAAAAIGGALVLGVAIGASLFTHRIKQKTQDDLLDAFDSMGETVRAFTSVQKAGAQAMLLEQRAQYEQDRAFNAMVDRKVKLLTAGMVPAGSLQAPAVPSWALEEDQAAVPAQAAGPGRNFRYVE